MKQLAAWLFVFALAAAAGAALGGPLTTMGAGGFTATAGPCSKILLNDGTSAILLNDGASFLCLN